MARVAVHINLREVLEDLSRFDRDAIGKALPDAGLAVAESAARAIRAALPKRSGRLADSVRTSRTRTGGAVRTGSRAVPYVGPVEFGGYPGSRPYLSQGRYIFPTARSFTDRAAERYAEEIQRAIDNYTWEHS